MSKTSVHVNYFLALGLAVLLLSNVWAADLGTQLNVQLDENPVYDPIGKDFVWGGLLRNISTQPVSAPIALVVDGMLPSGSSFVLQQADGLIPEGFTYKVIVPVGSIEAASEVRFLLHFGSANPISALAGEAIEKAAVKAFKSSLTPQANFSFNYHLAKIPAGNQRPIAQAIVSQSGPVGSEIVFDGSTSIDVDGQALSYAWTVLNRPNGSSAQLINSTSTNPTLITDVPGEYSVGLIVSDGYFFSERNTVKITVNAEGNVNHNPIIISLANTAGTATRGYAYTVVAGDADGNPLSYALTQAPTGMSINPSGVIQWQIPNIPNASIPVVVEVSDGNGGIAIQKFSIQIKPCTCI